MRGLCVEGWEKVIIYVIISVVFMFLGHVSQKMKFMDFSIFQLSERDDLGLEPGDNPLETHIPSKRVLRIHRVLNLR